ncbi:polymeric immunoglobulin receptor-like isoform X4 [Anabas testudineus]|uniref:polymeric immunoglobulin receptor-like isoform X4 n=1 Tax=Anabas testudineus TaxID=64144 RepID=UPI000E465FF4|nr:polymeric immunoglobulin receptor-like isoform X4 [Anabas testudineus]
MKNHHVLLFCFLSALWDGSTSNIIHQKKEGTQFRIQWKFSSSGSMKFFCRRECKGEDVLIKTPENTAQTDRYSTEFKNSSTGGGQLTVSITNLNRSDSGRYRFGLGSSLVPDSYRDFEIKVLDAQEEEFNIHTRDEGGNISVVCKFSFSKSRKFFCRNDCKEGNVLIETTEDRDQRGRYSLYYNASVSRPVLRVTIAELEKSDSGRYTCGLGESLSSASLQRFETVQPGLPELFQCQSHRQQHQQFPKSQSSSQSPTQSSSCLYSYVCPW